MQSRGDCRLSGKSTTKAALTRHLPGCVAEHPAKGKTQPALLVRTEADGMPEF